MKKEILILTLSLFTVGVCFTGCDSSEKRIDEEQKEMEKAEEEADREAAEEEAKKQLEEDMRIFRMEAEEQMAVLDKQIEDLRKEIAADKSKMKAERQKKLEELEEEKKTLRTRMDNFKENTREKWDAFTREFNHDMEELGQALKDLGTNNKK